jgi:hypothetical protein
LWLPPLRATTLASRLIRVMVAPASTLSVPRSPISPVSPEAVMSVKAAQDAIAASQARGDRVLIQLLTAAYPSKVGQDQ